MTGLSERARASEQMDDPRLDPAVYHRVLSDLARVNRWTFAARPTLAFLRRATSPGDRFRLLDVGFGHGDMLRRIAGWARRRGIRAELFGVDLNPGSLRAARAATPPGSGIRYVAGDYREVPGPFDFIISSLVAHHMDDRELTAFLRYMEANARRGWLVNDLHRHGLAYRAYPALARLISVHRIVREDGALSIARSFRPADWHHAIAEAVPESPARVQRRFPFRLCVERLF